MELRYITCSDPREQNSIKEMVELAGMPLVEIGVQCHFSEMGAGKPRNVWFNDLLRVARNDVDMNLAIHINSEWADSICAQGKIPDIIKDWLLLYKTDCKPVIQRVQLNMPKDTAQNIDIDYLLQTMTLFGNREFIFQYKKDNINAIRQLHRAVKRVNKTREKKSQINFAELFDSSGGRGISPQSWKRPVHKQHPMGYSGGISPDNVVQNLEEISCVVPTNRKIWIDAEGKLKPQGETYMDVGKAKLYVYRAYEWNKNCGRG